jgi:hypothetical protein
LTEISLNCSGDLRSATTDLEIIARNRDIVSLEDTKVVDYRTRLDFTPNILNKIFSSGSLQEARKTINQSMIKYDELYDWIYENIPIVLDDPKERFLALDALAKADIHQKRASKNDWRLLKYFFDLMTGGITISKKNSKGEGYRRQLITAILRSGLSPSMISIIVVPGGIQVKPNRWLGKEKWSQLNASLRGFGSNWIYNEKLWLLPYYREPQSKWRYIRSFHSRRRIKSVTKRLAANTHTSSMRAKNDILPILNYMIRKNKEMYEEISKWMLEPPINKLDNLRYMSFKKKPSDFVSLENYAKYKQREINKMIKKVSDETEIDTVNIKRWLAYEKKNAIWK